MPTQSSHYGYFYPLSCVFFSSAKRSTLIKAGVWNQVEDCPKSISIGNWRNLSDSEKLQTLNYLHELNHFIDVTSLPAGAFYWRLWDSLRTVGKDFLELVSDLRLDAQVELPLQLWLQNSGEQLLRDRVKERVKQGIEVRGYLLPEMKTGDQFVDDHLWRYLVYRQDLETTLALCEEVCANPSVNQIKSLNRIYTTIRNTNIYDSVFDAHEYEHTAAISLRRDHYELNGQFQFSLVGLFELRAYMREFAEIRRFNDKEFERVWLKNLKSKADGDTILSPIYDFLCFFAQQNVHWPWFIYLTDIALSSPIDLNCNLIAHSPGRVRKSRRFRFSELWPTCRFDRLLSYAMESPNILADPKKCTSEHAIRIARHFFGENTAPYTLINSCVRNMIPRERRTSSEKFEVTDLINYDYNATVDPFIKPENVFTSASYHNEINHIFSSNQKSYADSFLQFPSNAICLPRMILLDDYVSWSGDRPTAQNSNNQLLYSEAPHISFLVDLIQSQRETSLFKGNAIVDLADSIDRLANRSVVKQIFEKLGDRYGESLLKLQLPFAKF